MRSKQLTPRKILATATLFAIVAVVFEQFNRDSSLLSAIATPLHQPVTCAKVIDAKSRLKRETLAQALTIHQGKSHTAIRNVLPKPYCTLNTVAVRSGATTEREAYPLEFKPDTWLVVMYEGDTYEGFDFVMH
jgi:hypothetical protein